MAEYPDIEKALFETLTGDAGVSALVSTRVFDRFVPQAAARPYVVFYHAGGGPENITPRESVNAVFRVEAVAETGPAAKALFQAVYTALHDVSLSISGWSVFWTKVDSLRYLTETEDGRQFHRRIADVRIRAAEFR